MASYTNFIQTEDEAVRKSNLHTKHDKKKKLFEHDEHSTVHQLHNVQKAPVGLCYGVLAQIHSNRTDWLQANIIAPYAQQEPLKVPLAM